MVLPATHGSVPAPRACAGRERLRWHPCVPVPQVHQPVPPSLQYSWWGGQRNAEGLNFGILKEVQLLLVEGSGDISAEQGGFAKGPDQIRSEDQTQLNSAGGGQALKIFQLQPYTTSLSHRLEEKPQTFNTDPWNVTFKMDLRWFLMFFLQENFTPWTSSLPCPVRGKSAPETGAQEGKVLYFIHPENRRNWFGEFSPVLSSIGWVGGILMHSCFLLLGLWSCCGHTFLGFCCSHWVCRSLTWGTGKCQAWWKFFILLLRSFLQVLQCA